MIGQINPMINKPTAADMLISLNSPSNRVNTSKERNANNDVTPYKNKSVPHNLSMNQQMSKNNKDNNGNGGQGGVNSLL
jgi:hypothetical protein